MGIGGLAQISRRSSPSRSLLQIEMMISLQLRDGLMKTVEYFERLLRQVPRDERLPVRSANAAG